jgi:hypothetical protein
VSANLSPSIVVETVGPLARSESAVSLTGNSLFMAIFIEASELTVVDLAIRCDRARIFRFEAGTMEVRRSNGNAKAFWELDSFSCHKEEEKY